MKIKSTTQQMLDRLRHLQRETFGLGSEKDLSFRTLFHSARNRESAQELVDQLTSLHLSSRMRQNKEFPALVDVFVVGEDGCEKIVATVDNPGISLPGLDQEFEATHYNVVGLSRLIHARLADQEILCDGPMYSTIMHTLERLGFCEQKVGKEGAEGYGNFSLNEEKPEIRLTFPDLDSEQRLLSPDELNAGFIGSCYRGATFWMVRCRFDQKSAKWKVFIRQVRARDFRPDPFRGYFATDKSLAFAIAEFVAETL